MNDRIEISLRDWAEGNRIAREDFIAVVESDPCLHWYEDLDERHRRRKEERASEWKVSFVYKYEALPVGPELHGTYISGKIWIKVNRSTLAGRKKVEELCGKWGAEFREL